MPRNPNEPEPMNPDPSSIGRGGQREHLDNNNLNNPSNPGEFRDIANRAEQNANGGGSDTNNGGAVNTNPTVTLTGDVTGTKQVAPGTQLMDVIAGFTSDLKDLKLTRVDGSSVKLTDEVKGDISVNIEKPENKPENKTESKPEEKPQGSGPSGNTQGR